MRRLVGLTLGLLLGLAISAVAQEATTVGVFFVPKIGTGAFHDAFRPKYFTKDDISSATPPLIVVPATQIDTLDYAAESIYLVVASVTASQRTTLSAQVDVLTVPAALDSNVSGAALPTVQSKLEAMNLPGNFVTTAMTYRQVVSRIRKIIMYRQRLQGIFPSDALFGGGITLDTRWNQLSQALRDRLRAAADSLALDTTGVTSITTVRDMLLVVGDQLPPLTMLGDVF